MWRVVTGRTLTDEGRDQVQQSFLDRFRVRG
jgi:hypothetical protein